MIKLFASLSRQSAVEICFKISRFGQPPFGWVKCVRTPRPGRVYRRPRPCNSHIPQRVVESSSNGHAVVIVVKRTSMAHPDRPPRPRAIPQAPPPTKPAGGPQVDRKKSHIRRLQWVPDWPPRHTLQRDRHRTILPRAHLPRGVTTTPRRKGLGPRLGPNNGKDLGALAWDQASPAEAAGKVT